MALRKIKVVAFSFSCESDVAFNTNLPDQEKGASKQAREERKVG